MNKLKAIFKPLGAYKSRCNQWAWGRVQEYAFSTSNPSGTDTRDPGTALEKALLDQLC